MKGYEEPIVLRGRYRLNWRDFPSEHVLGCPSFRYLHVEILGAHEINNGDNKRANKTDADNRLELSVVSAESSAAGV